MLKLFVLLYFMLWMACCGHAALQKNPNQNVPGWIQYLTSVGNNEDTVKDDLETFESKFDMIKPIGGSPHHPSLSTFHDSSPTSFLKMPLITFYGAGELNSLMFQGGIRSYGPLQLNHVDVVKLYVEGMLNAQDLTVSELQARGDARLVHAYVSGSTSVLGELSANRSVFKRAIHLKGSRLILTKCELQGNLHVESPQQAAPKPRIYLIQGTHIQGDVKCDKACEVFLESGCKIHGNVLNAVVKTINPRKL